MVTKKEEKEGDVRVDEGNTKEEEVAIVFDLNLNLEEKQI